MAKYKNISGKKNINNANANIPATGFIKDIILFIFFNVNGQQSTDNRLCPHYSFLISKTPHSDISRRHTVTSLQFLIPNYKTFSNVIPKSLLNGIPISAACFGIILASDIPGTIFTSMKKSPSSLRM